MRDQGKGILSNPLQSSSCLCHKREVKEPSFLANASCNCFLEAHSFIINSKVKFNFLKIQQKLNGLLNTMDDVLWCFEYI